MLKGGKALVHKEISQAVIARLPRYYRYLHDLLDEGIERISSGELSKRMQITASQIRQDLNNFGGFGQQGYGYNVQHLYEEIGKILGLDKTHNIIIVGAGNLGQALANHMGFEKKGLLITGIFDTNPELVGSFIRGIQVRPIEELEDFIKNNHVEIAALTVPKAKAEDMAKMLALYGIKGIWNFVSTDLHVSDTVVVENVQLSESLMRLSYRINNMSDVSE